MALHKVPAHPCRGGDSTLQIDLAVFLKGAEICPAERFGSNANREGRLGKGGDGQASAIDTDAVSKVAVAQDFRGIGDSESRSPVLGLGIELGDNYGQFRTGCRVRK